MSYSLHRYVTAVQLEKKQAKNYCMHGTVINKALAYTALVEETLPGIVTHGQFIMKVHTLVFQWLLAAVCCQVAAALCQPG